MSEQTPDPRPTPAPFSAPRSQAEGVAHGLAHSFLHPEVYANRPGRLAQPGEPKYSAQVWAGLIQDDAELAAEKQRRAQAQRDVEERRRRLRSVDATLVRDVLSAARARSEG
jgi:hypothetical protein